MGIWAVAGKEKSPISKSFYIRYKVFMSENQNKSIANLHVSKSRLLKDFFYYSATMIVLLAVCDAVFNFMNPFDSLQIRRIFNIAKEGSVPSFFSVFLLVGVAFWAFCFSWIHSARLGTLRKWLWLFVGCLFLFLAVDDASQVHERLGSFFRKYVEAASESGQQHWGDGILDWHGSYSWHVAVLPFIALAGMGMFLFLWFELGDARGRGLLSLGIFCFVLAIGIDYLEGLDTFFVTIGKPLNVSDYFIDHFCKLIEECLEMIGAVLIGGALLRHLLNSTSRVEVTLQA